MRMRACVRACVRVCMCVCVCVRVCFTEKCRPSFARKKRFFFSWETVENVDDKKLIRFSETVKNRLDTLK